MKYSALLCLLVSTCRFRRKCPRHSFRREHSVQNGQGHVAPYRPPRARSEERPLSTSPALSQVTNSRSTSTTTPMTRFLCSQGEVNLKQGPSLHLMKHGRVRIRTDWSDSRNRYRRHWRSHHDQLPESAGPDPLHRSTRLQAPRRRTAERRHHPRSCEVRQLAGEAGTLHRHENRFQSRQRTSPNSAERRRIFTKVGDDGEGLLFVWKGKIRVTDGSQTWNAGERDTVFAQGAANLEAVADGPAEIIEVSAP